jgi:hypothetical protein
LSLPYEVQTDGTQRKSRYDKLSRNIRSTIPSAGISCSCPRTTAYTWLCPWLPFVVSRLTLVSFIDLPKMQTLTPLKSHKTEVFGLLCVLPFRRLSSRGGLILGILPARFRMSGHIRGKGESIS